MKSAIFGIVFSVALILFPPVAPCAEDARGELPAIVLSGLKAYQSDGAEAAIRAWIKGSPLQKKEKETLAYAKEFTVIEEFYGKYAGFHLIEEKEITEVSKLIVLTIDFEKGPVFARFLAYRQKKDWILVSFDFNTKPEAIMPGLFLK